MSSPPPTLPTDAVAVEKLARSALVTKFGDIEGLPHVLDHFVYISGETEFVRRFGVKNEATLKTEYRALFIVFTGFDDSEEGCEDKPAYYVTYTLRLVVSLAERPNGGGNSTDDFAAIVMTLRQRVLDERHLDGYQQLRCQNLKRDSSDFGLEEETGLNAHSADLSLRVEVSPS